MKNVFQPYLDFADVGANAAVHSMKSDGVELALVQVDHWQLVGLVRGSQRSSQGKLELVPEPLGWGSGIGTRINRTGVFLEGVVVRERLETHKKISLKKTVPYQTQTLSPKLPMTLNTPQDLGQGKNRTLATSAAGSQK